MREDEQRLQQHLDVCPDDREARLVLADLFEENGHPRPARLQRWLAEQDCWPDADLAFLDIRGWHWWATVSEDHCHREHARLPYEVQRFMPAGEWLYATRQEAEEVLAVALERAGLLAVAEVAAR